MRKFDIMHKAILVLVLISISGYGFCQNCITQDLDNRSPDLTLNIERQLAEAEGSSARSITYIQTVVHVLWNHPNNNLPDSVITANIDLVNKDLRRQNADTSETPDYFLPVAADTEIELRLAQVDPNGQPTNGITHTYTDSISFSGFLNHMKYDSTGGVNAWDTEQYLNIWVIRSIDFTPTGTVLGYTNHVDSSAQTEVGIVIRRSQFQTDQGWRTLSHEFGHFACLLHPLGFDTCYDADLVEDTPIGQAVFTVDCSDTVITCSNGPYGNMHQNFMWYGPVDCMNLFTEGQKAGMLNCIETQYPGLTEYLFLGVDDVAKSQLEVYPNPSHDQLNFQSSDRGNLSVLDLRGRTILSFAATEGKNKVNIESLPNGIYLLQLETERGVSAARFIKY